MNLNKLFLEVLNEVNYDVINEDNNIKFEEYWNDSYKGEDFGGMDMVINGKVVANAQYSKVGHEVYISYIETYVKGNGYGQELMKHLASIYGYENLIRSSLTPDGAKMRQKLDKHFNFDLEKHIESKNKHLELNIIKSIPNEMIKDFIMYMVKNGYQQTWVYFLKNPNFRKLSDFIDNKYGFDFNDISSITEWIKGSVTNDNDPEDEVPDWVNEMLEKLNMIPKF